MIISRTPFRISFAGGGSDIESYYAISEGAVLSASINKYSYILIHKLFSSHYKYSLKYSITENINSYSEISHPIFKEVLSNFEIKDSIEITSIADIPSGTGLASSSAFSASLISAINFLLDNKTNKKELAEKVCDLEINKLNEPIGKQDQYACVFGGLNFFTFSNSGGVKREKILLSNDEINYFDNNLMLFYTGLQRKTSSILSIQNSNIKKKSIEFNNMQKSVELAYAMKDNLLFKNFDAFGENLHKAWTLKKTFSKSITNSNIDHYYNLAINNGALGGKISGAGGGGFLMIYCPIEKQLKVREALSDLNELNFNFENLGNKIVTKA